MRTSNTALPAQKLMSSAETLTVYGAVGSHCLDTGHLSKMFTCHELANFKCGIEYLVITKMMLRANKEVIAIRTFEAIRKDFKMNMRL